MAVAFRPMADSDRPLVIDSWVRSYRLSHSAGIVSMANWFEVMGREVPRILARDGCETTIATDSADSDFVYGWISVERGYDVPFERTVIRNGRPKQIRGFEVIETPLIHYVFIKQPYRSKHRILERLIEAAGVNPDEPFNFTCRTPWTDRRPLRNGTWLPLVARHDKHRDRSTDNNSGRVQKEGPKVEYVRKGAQRIRTAGRG